MRQAAWAGRDGTNGMGPKEDTTTVPAPFSCAQRAIGKISTAAVDLTEASCPKEAFFNHETCSFFGLRVCGGG